MAGLRLSKRSRSRGFTLMELLIAIAIIATLSALALVGFRKYIHAAQSSEARAVLGQIRAGEEAYKVEMLRYLSCSGSLTDYYPNSSPVDDSRWVWQRPNDSRYYFQAGPPPSGWQLLNVNPDAPVRYGYAVVAGVGPNALPSPDPAFAQPPVLSTTAAGVPWFVAAAKNKHVTTWQPSLAITTSYDGTVYYEGEGN
jgi:type IV pilus assembly protein PilA